MQPNSAMQQVLMAFFTEWIRESLMKGQLGVAQRLPVEAALIVTSECLFELANDEYPTKMGKHNHPAKPEQVGSCQ